MAGHIKVATPKVRKRLKRKVSIRLRMSGTAERPRLSVFRSAKHVYVQAIDDVTGRVLASASDLEPSLKGSVAGKPKKERARAIGKAVGDKLVALKIEAVVFDRNGFIYHGRVKEVADGARDAGLKF
ncbi:MAG: 50S ribosomal protein L18 [Proteobacteria bacterium]|nr:50S ribosomal protein L18 [Pseudomonadota bacterium]